MSEYGLPAWPPEMIQKINDEEYFCLGCGYIIYEYEMFGDVEISQIERHIKTCDGIGKHRYHSHMATSTYYVRVHSLSTKMGRHHQTESHGTFMVRNLTTEEFSLLRVEKERDLRVELIEYAESVLRQIAELTPRDEMKCQVSWIDEFYCFIHSSDFADHEGDKCIAASNFHSAWEAR